ncbi:unnamed protein product [Allacma fusca]|uniref:Transmembrane protein n=1 Tax=Allacma fusca TaxID=39272 RepID=A0A8J2K897_9HEXA|nr:unnamed protein product [Allacma fusca]
MKVCFCLPLNQAVKIVAMISILAGIITASVSSWVLHKAMQAVKNPTKKTAENLLFQVNLFFGGTTGLYDLDVIFRILTYCSGTALVGGFIQFLMSFWLLMASVRGGRKMALVWVIVHIVILIAIGGSFLCILTNELQITMALQVFLPVTGIDSLLIIFFCWVAFNFSRGTEDDDDSVGRSRTYFLSASGNVDTTVTDSKAGVRDEPLRAPRRGIKPVEASQPLMQTDF